MGVSSSRLDLPSRIHALTEPEVLGCKIPAAQVQEVWNASAPRHATIQMTFRKPPDPFVPRTLLTKASS